MSERTLPGAIALDWRLTGWRAVEAPHDKATHISMVVHRDARIALADELGRCQQLNGRRLEETNVLRTSLQDTAAALVAAQAQIRQREATITQIRDDADTQTAYRVRLAQQVAALRDAQHTQVTDRQDILSAVQREADDAQAKLIAFRRENRKQEAEIVDLMVEVERLRAQVTTLVSEKRADKEKYRKIIADMRAAAGRRLQRRAQGR